MAYFKRAEFWHRTGTSGSRSHPHCRTHTCPTDRNPDLYPLKGKRAEGVVTAIGALTDKERTLIRPFVSDNCKFPICVNRKLHTWKFVGGSEPDPLKRVQM